jgi:hypothetical protein
MDEWLIKNRTHIKKLSKNKQIFFRENMYKKFDFWI